jgi:hypothetical protein
MRQSLEEVTHALRTLGRADPWSPDIKATDDFLEPLFKSFFTKLGLPLQIRKSEYHVLAGLLQKERLDPEASRK